LEPDEDAFERSDTSVEDRLKEEEGGGEEVDEEVDEALRAAREAFSNPAVVLFRFSLAVSSVVAKWTATLNLGS